MVQLIITPLSSLLSSSRLFYLYQDTMPQIINEEKFFSLLSWISVLLSGVIASMSMGGSFLNAGEFHSSFKSYGSCQEEIPLSLDIIMVLSLFLILFTFGTQIALFFKQRQLRKERASGITVVIYNIDGVTISSRSADRSVGRKLIDFNRTVVSPKAGFLVFLANALRVFIHILLYLFEGSSYPSSVSQFAIYVEFCVLFFLLPVVETYYSPTLLNTMIDYIPCHRHAYVVDV